MLPSSLIRLEICNPHQQVGGTWWRHNMAMFSALLEMGTYQKEGDIVFFLLYHT